MSNIILTSADILEVAISMIGATTKVFAFGSAANLNTTAQNTIQPQPSPTTQEDNKQILLREIVVEPPLS